MPLQVQCANGHKLICRDDLAGTSVICPKCGSRTDVSARNVVRTEQFVDEVAVASLSGIHRRGDSAVKLPETADVVASSPLGDTKISFHCPNGHKLTGPATLQGQEGECPQCKTRFRVPWSKAPNDDTTPESDEASDSDEGITEISLDEIEEIDLPSHAAEHQHAAAKPTHSEPTGSSLAVFERLWRERQHGGKVTLHLGQGVSIEPLWWSRNSSCEQYGYFALEGPNDTFEVQAIAWRQIDRICVRDLKELPGELLD